MHIFKQNIITSCHIIRPCHKNINWMIFFETFAILLRIVLELKVEWIESIFDDSFRVRRVEKFRLTLNTIMNYAIVSTYWFSNRINHRFTNKAVKYPSILSSFVLSEKLICFWYYGIVLIIPQRLPTSITHSDVPFFNAFFHVNIFVSVWIQRRNW